VDNNRSEAALRVVALGRKNFLFVGHESAPRRSRGSTPVLFTLSEGAKKRPLR
jgi:transposase